MLLHVATTKGRSYNRGPWNDVTDRYLGFRFVIKEGWHYGWAQLSVNLNENENLEGTLTGYAYESVPLKPIIAGKIKGPDVITVQTGSLGALAAGATKPRRVGP